MAMESRADVKSVVAEALTEWQAPPAKALGQIWLIAVGALALITVVVVGSLIVFLWNDKDITELSSLATLLLGAFIGWLGGSKANPAP